MVDVWRVKRSLLLSATYGHCVAAAELVSSRRQAAPRVDVTCRPSFGWKRSQGSAPHARCEELRYQIPDLRRHSNSQRRARRLASDLHVGARLRRSRGRTHQKEKAHPCGATEQAIGALSLAPVNGRSRSTADRCRWYARCCSTQMSHGSQRRPIIVAALARTLFYPTWEAAVRVLATRRCGEVCPRSDATRCVISRYRPTRPPVRVSMPSSRRRRRDGTMEAAHSSPTARSRRTARCLARRACASSATPPRDTCCRPHRWC